MNNKVFQITSALIISSISFSIGIACNADFKEDYSKWSYDDLMHAGMKLNAMNKREAALRFLNRAVQAAPNNPEAYINRGAILELMHRNKESIEDQKRALALTKDNDESSVYYRSVAHQNLALLYKENKQLTKAEKEARLAIKVRPNRADTHETLGDVLKEENKTSEALNCYTKAKELYAKEGLDGEATHVEEKIAKLQGKPFQSPPLRKPVVIY